MGTLQSSGEISFNDMQTQLGGSNPIGFDEYYRGGSYVPSTGVTGPNYSTSAPFYYWMNNSYYGTIVGTEVYWNGTLVHEGALTDTSVTVGSDTYTRPTGASNVVGTPDDLYTYYTVSKTSPKNTSVPTSGTISMSNMYGASNP